MTQTHILVVDDNPTSTQMMTILLNREGYRVTAKNDPFETLKWLRNPANRPDLLISDLNMPGMSGHDLVRHIKKDPALTHLPIIMLTAQSDMAQKVSGFEAGVDDYLIKPVNSTELLLRIKALLSRAQVASDASAPMEGEVITVFSLRGGVGTTSLAVNLSVALTMLWQMPRLPLVDLALKNGHCALMLNIKPRNTIIQVAERNEQDLDIDLLEALLLKHKSGVALLPAPRSPVEAELVTPRTIDQVIPYLRLEYPFVVVDAGSDLSEIALTAFDHSSHIVIPVAPDLASLKAAADALHVFKQLDYNKDHIFPVFNNIFPRSTLTLRDVETALGRKGIASLPFAQETIVEAINTGTPFVVSRPALPISKAIAKLAYTFSPQELKDHPPQPLSPLLTQLQAKR